MGGGGVHSKFLIIVKQHSRVATLIQNQVFNFSNFYFFFFVDYNVRG